MSARVTIAAIGKARPSSPESLLVAEYVKRNPWKIVLKECDIKATDPQTRKLKEGDALLAACGNTERLIALDEGGKNLSSREFAKLIADLQQQGISSLAFIIGGADGLSEPLKAKAHQVISFGKATWPHMLVRAMLAEQLYRAQSILEGHPYHRD